MKKTLIAFIVLAATASVHAADMSGIAAIAQAEHQGQVEHNRRVDAENARIDAQQQAQERRQRAAAAAAHKRAAAAQAAHAAVVKRENAYQDKLRDIELRRQELALKREEARVNREDEYIDQELRAASAASDVVKSEADANRATAQGVKTLMEKEGEARVKKESGWFN
ncbi:DUF5384 family protein [Enterobacter hormaechei]